MIVVAVIVYALGAFGSWVGLTVADEGAPDPRPEPERIMLAVAWPLAWPLLGGALAVGYAREYRRGR